MTDDLHPDADDLLGPSRRRESGDPQPLPLVGMTSMLGVPPNGFLAQWKLLLPIRNAVVESVKVGAIDRLNWIQRSIQLCPGILAQTSSLQTQPDG